MGPLVYTSGNAGRSHEQAAVTTASMGPLVYTSGNSSTIVCPGDTALRFNGAAGLHQRKPARVGSVRCGLWRFNGAAGLHQRKPGLPAGELRPDGELQWGRWFTPAETCRSICWAAGASARFNGAAGLHQRKRVEGSQSVPHQFGLQWGRWFTPAETMVARQAHDPDPRASMGPLVYTSGNRFKHSQAGVGCQASMGPLVYTSGNYDQAKARLHRIGQLQWGRWFTPAETSTTDIRPYWLELMLQWGRWFTPAETTQRIHPSESCSISFNGAAGLHQRKRGRGR